jgi:hypothetical protein
MAYTIKFALRLITMKSITIYYYHAYDTSLWYHPYKSLYNNGLIARLGVTFSYVEEGDIKKYGEWALRPSPMLVS